MAKEGIHPTYYAEARVICACGNTFTTGSTMSEIKTDICYNCHPFYTGEQRIVDTAGQVDRFMKRLQVGSSIRSTPRQEKKSRKPIIETADEGEE
ncbi:MAG: 50S ribosomal protein L31 [Ardenticatenales bacterium]|nr:50S ribosomal protein L31 [Ardenticatenales bacterium]